MDKVTALGAETAHILRPGDDVVALCGRIAIWHPAPPKLRVCRHCADLNTPGHHDTSSADSTDATHAAASPS